MVACQFNQCGFKILDISLILKSLSPWKIFTSYPLQKKCVKANFLTKIQIKDHSTKQIIQSMMVKEKVISICNLTALN